VEFIDTRSIGRAHFASASLPEPARIRCPICGKSTVTKVVNNWLMPLIHWPASAQFRAADGWWCRGAYSRLAELA
jgi:hypothetical protein